jgi:hypothetical protein
VEEQRVPLGPAERPLPPGDGEGPAAGVAGVGIAAAASPLDDPRALTILTTEHWGLLSHRALVYNEAFARAGMFLTFLSATLVALGLVATATGFSREFLGIAAVVLTVDLFVGFATMGRMAAASNEDLRCLQGMNRLRHAYHEMVPGLEPYVLFGKHDDLAGVFAVYGDPPGVGALRGFLHGLTTAIGMISVICASVAGVLAGVLVLLATTSGIVAGVAGLAAFVLVNAIELRIMVVSVVRLARSLEPRFPSPSRDPRP